MELHFTVEGRGGKGGSRGRKWRRDEEHEASKQIRDGVGKRRMRVTQRVQWCKVEGGMHKERGGGEKIDVVRSNKGNSEMREEGL